MDLALVSCVTLPEPDPDAAVLAEALHAAGISAEVLAWDDPRADFTAATLTVFRSCWNYHRAPTAFEAWLARTAGTTNVWNPPATVRWNMHKRYLLDLASAGVRTIPTELIPRGSGVTLATAAGRLGASAVVVKPAVSAGSRETMLVRDLPGSADGEAHLRKLVALEDTLVQPYLPSVEGYGERSLIWIDGQVTHAIRKTARFSGESENVSSEAMPITQDELDLARRAVSAAPGPLLYARVDMARDAAGRPLLMELELIEPSLFFPQHPPALRRFVAAIRRRLSESTRQ